MINSYKSNVAVQPLWQNLDWSSKRDVNVLPEASSGSCVDFVMSQQKFQEDTWVHLLELPSPFSFDEALLLCQQSEDEWVVWIPNHGEAVLNVSQFCAA